MSLSLQDALIDVAVSLGAPLSKLILTAPAFANSFNLVDPERNLPGSAVTGLPTTLTYQQVPILATSRGLQRDVVYFWLTNSVLVYEPKCAGGGGELQGLSQ
jgi:hypothetical protein